MSEKILKIIAVIAKKTTDELADLKNEQGLWDSLLHVELIVALEAEFDIFFSPEEISQIDTPAKVIDVVTLKISSNEA